MSKVYKIYNPQRGWYETMASYIPHAHETPHRVGYFELDEIEEERMIRKGLELSEVTVDDYIKLRNIRNDLNEKLSLIESELTKEPKTIEYGDVSIKTNKLTISLYNWLTIDEDGLIHVWEKKPKIYHLKYCKGSWIDGGGCMLIGDALRGYTGYYTKWEDSLLSMDEFRGN